MPDVVEKAHISSLVIYCIPEKLTAIKSEINAIKNAEVAADDASGKLILVLETETERDILFIIDRIQLLPGVLTTTMVYHEIDC